MGLIKKTGKFLYFFIDCGYGISPLPAAVPRAIHEQFTKQLALKYLLFNFVIVLGFFVEKSVTIDEDEWRFELRHIFSSSFRALSEKKLSHVFVHSLPLRCWRVLVAVIDAALEVDQPLLGVVIFAARQFYLLGWLEERLEQNILFKVILECLSAEFALVLFFHRRVDRL